MTKAFKEESNNGKIIIPPKFYPGNINAPTKYTASSFFWACDGFY